MAACSSQQLFDPVAEPDPSDVEGPVTDTVVAPELDDPSIPVRTFVLQAQVRVPTVLDGVVEARPDVPLGDMPLADVGVIMLNEELTEIRWSGRSAGGTVDVPLTALPGTLVVVADGSPHSDISVIDCPLADCDESAVWSYAWPVNEESPATLTMSSTEAAAGAFHIQDALRAAESFFRSWSGPRSLEPLRARWEPGSDTQCGTSCFTGSGSAEIFVYAVQGDTDEFDRQILMHEYGHFLEDAVLANNTTGGFHDGSPAPAALAFSEGFCTGFATAASGLSTYVDSSLQGGAWAEYGPGSRLPATEPSPAARHSEETIAGIFADLLSDRSGAFAESLRQIMGSVDPMAPFRRYAPGFDVGDFMDLLRCTSQDDQAVREYAAGWGFELREPVEDCPLAVRAPTPPSPDGAPHQSPITPMRVSSRQSDGQVILLVEARTTVEDLDILVQPEEGEPALATEASDIESGWEWKRTFTPSEAATTRIRLTIRMPGGATYFYSAAVAPAEPLLAVLPPLQRLPDGRLVRLDRADL
jgi:hypothetical protein